MPNVEFAGVAGPMSNTAKKVSGDFGIRSFDALAAILSHIDAVSTCVPDRLTEASAIEALEGSKSILLEKPMSITSMSSRSTSLRQSDS